MKKSTLLHIACSLWITLVLPAGVRAADYYFVTLDYPPLAFKDKTDTPQGAAVDIVKAIMERLGHTVSVEVLPWTRAVKMVQHGRADAIFTIFKNPEREQFLDFSSEVLVPQVVAFYTLKKSAIAYDGNLERLKHLRIGVVSTISYGRKFDGARQVLKVERTASLKQNFSKMVLGRIDLVISNAYSADIVIHQMHITDAIKRIEPYVEIVPSYIAFSKVKANAVLQKGIDSKLREIKKNGLYDKIVAKWDIVIP